MKLPPTLKYNFFSAARRNKRGYGVPCLYLSTKHCEQIYLGEFTSFEYIGMHLKGNQPSLMLVSLSPTKTQHTSSRRAWGFAPRILLTHLRF